MEPVGRRPDKYYPQVSLIQKVQFQNLESASQNGITPLRRDDHST